MTTARRPRVLFVCARNRRRSLTAEHLFRDDPRVEVRSAGLRGDANRRIRESDLRWADAVYVMERSHQRQLAELFPSADLPRTEVLDIPDDFEYMDATLQEMLKLTLDPEFDVLAAQSRDAL